MPDLHPGDVPIDGAHIVDVGADLRHRVRADEEVIDGSGCNIVPGFDDTHRHMREAVLRGVVPESTLDGYFERMLFGVAPHLTPDELGISEMLAALASLALHDSAQTTGEDRK